MSGRTICRKVSEAKKAGCLKGGRYLGRATDNHVPVKAAPASGGERAGRVEGDGSDAGERGNGEAFAKAGKGEDGDSAEGCGFDERSAGGGGGPFTSRERGW